VARWQSAVAHNEYEFEAGREPRLTRAQLRDNGARVEIVDRVGAGETQVYFVAAPIAGRPNRVIVSSDAAGAIRPIVTPTRVIL
jgi:hypothetical protein